MVVAIIDFVSVIDLLPDFLPRIGLADDAAVMGLVIAQTQVDLDNFLAWEVEGTHRDNETGSTQTLPAWVEHLPVGGDGSGGENAKNREHK